jgi:uncharacterized protein (DUF4213/DUF364 family)
MNRLTKETLIHRLYHESSSRAAEVTITSLTVGLGYTAVTTSDGGLGLAYTWIGGKEDCKYHKAYRDVEGECARELLDRLLTEDPFQRSLGLATLNALHQEGARSLPDDSGSPLSASLQLLGLVPGTRVSMVGYFPPLARILPDLGIDLDIVDASLNLGDPAAFRERLGWWTDALLMTATTILNDSAEDLLMSLGPQGRAVMIGPSTPLVPAAFAHLPIVGLAGIAPVDIQSVVKTVRHGSATPGMRPFVRKVYASCIPADNAHPHASARRGILAGR